MRINPADLRPRPDSPFSAEERAIFRYGVATGLKGDPLAIEARHDAAFARVNPTAVGRWLLEPNANLNLMGFRRLVPVAHEALGTVPLDPGTGTGLTSDEVLAVLRRFFAFRDRVTRQFREEAELAATYGPSPGSRGSYLHRCGLWWNRHRVQALAGVAFFRGATAAAGGPLHATLADAMARSAHEARLIEEQYDSDRAEAAAKAALAAQGGR